MPERRKAWRNEAGETMVETLVSILVSALALTMLATVIGTSVNLVRSSREKMGEFYASETSMLREPEADATTTRLKIEIPLETGKTEQEVKMYSTEGDTSIVYYERSTS